MSDVRGYTPGQTGTLADVVEQGPDLRPFKPAGPDSFAPPPTSGELFHAYRAQNRPYRTDFDEIMLRDGYAPIVDALGLGSSENPARFFDLDPGAEARFGSLGQPSEIATAAGQGEQLPLGRTRLASRSLQEQLIADRIRSRRATTDPDFLAGVPDTVDGLHRYFREQEAKKRAAAGSTIGRGPGGLGQALTALGGGGVEAFHDPLNIATLPLGGGGKTLLQVIGREALINGVIEAVSLPSAAGHLEELGEHLTAGEAVQDIGIAAVFGGVLGGVIHVGATHVPPTLFKVMPETVQRRWADRMRVGGDKGPLLKDVLGDMDNRELAGFARSAIGGRMTPDERAAASALEREQELGEASPFAPGPAGEAAHDANLADTLKSIIDGAPRERPVGPLLSSTSLTPGGISVDVGRSAVPHDIVDFFRAKGLSEGQAYGIAAGIVAESGGNHTIVNARSGAAFLGQWLGSRKAELIRRYGPNPSREQQLEFLWHELTGGDPGGKHVLAEQDPGRVLDAYIRRFMRPAAGAETIGDLERGMAALGRKGEMPEGSIGEAAGDDELAAALRQQADDAEAEAIAAAEGRESLDAELGRPAQPEPPDFPILRRELFASDADWFGAQLGFYKSQGVFDPEGRSAPAGGPPARETVGGRPETASSAPTLQQWFSGSLVADEHGRPLTVYHGSGSEFDTFDVERAGGGRGSPGEQALFFSTDPDVASHSALVAGAGHATGEPTHTGAFAHNGGVVYPVHLRVENPLISKLKFYNSVEFAKEIARAKADGHDGVIFPHVKSRGENGTIAVFSPDQVRSIFADATAVRIDDPELQAFDDGASGRADQVESLEHDLRMQAEEQAAAHLERRFAELGPPPPRPKTALQSIGEILRKKSKEAGIRYRIDADDAISHGVDADVIYINPKARYPVVKLQLAGIFAASKAPLKSKATATKLVSLDYFGDRLDPASYGLNPEVDRLEPEDVADLLRASLEKSPNALDQSDPNYRTYVDWAQRHEGLMALTGEAAHPVTGETMPEAQLRAEALRDSFAPVEAGGAPGTHNIGNSAPAAGGETRGELRVKIFKALLAKPARAERQAHLVLGPPAAGKSSFAEPLAEATGARLIDADDAKAMLPEYEDGIGAAAVHEESTRLADTATTASVRNGDNIVLPLVGRTYEGVAAKIRDLTSAGYTVHVHLVDLPGEKAVDRAIARFSQTGRLVDPEYVRSVGDLPRETFARIRDEYKDQLGGHVHVTNDVPFGEKPRLVEASSEELAARLGFDRGTGAGEDAGAARGEPGRDAGAAAEQGLPELAGERRYRLGDDGRDQTLSEILAELDGDRAAVDALRACAAPRAAA